MQEFKTYHPCVNFVYYLAVLGFSMVFMHPITLGISLITGLVYSIMLNGKKTLRFNILYMLPLILATSLINPILNHEGMTILGYFPSGNPLTLESVLYGVAAAVMLAGVICHFSCINEIMTSDKLMHLFGRIIPALSLIFSMVLRFVPRFKKQLKTVRYAQRCVGRDVADGNIIQKVKNGVKILSVMITWCLENAIDTADSMKSRGYGLPKRSAYSDFRLGRRDVTALLYIAVLSVYIMVGGLRGQLSFKYFPAIKGAELTHYVKSLFAAYMMLFMYPVIIEVREVLRWKKLKSKI